MLWKIFSTLPANLPEVILAALAPYSFAHPFCLHRIVFPRNHAAVRNHSVCFQLLILVRPQMPVVLQLIILWMSRILVSHQEGREEAQISEIDDYRLFPAIVLVTG